MSLKRLLVIATMALAIPAGVADAQKSPDDRAARLASARAFMAVTGSTRQFDEIMPLLGRQLEQAFVNLAPQRGDEVRAVMKEVLSRVIARKGELVERIAAIYADSLTAADLDELARFYTTGVGARLVAAQSEITKRSVAEGQRWGAAIGREIEAEMRRELKKRGFDL